MEFDSEPTDPHRTLDPDERLALHGEPTGDDLLAAVLADPDSDEPRLVYGDYLLERGDPRGELIQLQLRRGRGGRAADRSVRERNLIKEHVATWCAPLFEVLHPRTIVFERGFLARCTPVDGQLALRDLIGHPAWATVEHLDTEEHTLAGHPVMRALRSLITSLDTVGRLVEVSHRVRLEELATWSPLSSTGDSYDQVRYRKVHEMWPALLAVGALTEVTTLRIQGQLPIHDPVAHQLLQSALGQQLAQLEVGEPTQDSPTWDLAIRDHPSLRRLRLHPYSLGIRYAHIEPPDDGGVIAIERDERGEQRLRLTLDHRPPHELCLEHARRLADRYRVLWVDGTTQIRDEYIAEIRAQLGPVFDDIVVT